VDGKAPAGESGQALTERWQAAQRQEDEFWKRAGVLDGQMQRVLNRYVDAIADLSAQLPQDCAMLDVGCGPTCVARLFSVGSKTYIDPLMDSYSATYADRMPAGELICGTAEAIPRPDESFDVVLSANALDHMMNPDAALVEMRRVLKADGVFVLILYTHSPLEAVGRGVLERYVPALRHDAHPYCYIRRSIRKVLERHFIVREQTPVWLTDKLGLRPIHREEWLFICEKRSPADADAH